MSRVPLISACGLLLTTLWLYSGCDAASSREAPEESRQSSQAQPPVVIASTPQAPHAHNPSNAPDAVEVTTAPADPAAATASDLAAAPAPGKLTSSVTVYLKLVIDKDYGMLAKLSGKRDSSERSEPYDIANAWWDNPLVVYIDPPLPAPDTLAAADARPISGEGSSKNVAVELTLIPRAELAIDTTPASDAVAGTMTLTISSVASYYDGRWEQMVDVKDRRVTFTFDTRAPGRPVKATGHETRQIPQWTFNRYTRDRERWETRSQWPTEPQSGDWRTMMTGRNIAIDLTGYRYLD